MEDEYHLIIDPVLYTTSDERTSKVLDQHGQPYTVKKRKPTIGFKLKRNSKDKLND